MGAHAQMDITADEARQVLINRILRASDGELEDLLFEVYGDSKLYTFNVVTDYSESSWIRYIDNKHSFE